VVMVELNLVHLEVVMDQKTLVVEEDLLRVGDIMAVLVSLLSHILLDKYLKT
jgi:hypothetical protein